MPGSPAYVNASRLYVKSIVRKPLAVVRCKNVSDVSQALVWAGSVGVCVSVKSSGHSMLATSVLDGRLVIDLSALNTINVIGQNVVAGPGTQVHTSFHQPC
jgi:FAD/FMN-containing dehydrogenase